MINFHRLSSSTEQASGTLTLADIDTLVENLRTHCASRDDVMVVSPWLAEHWDEIQRRARIESERRIRRYRAEQRKAKRLRTLRRRQRRARQRKQNRGKR